jgi:hypothetical protein
MEVGEEVASLPHTWREAAQFMEKNSLAYVNYQLHRCHKI